jgi:hypothetical protein
MAFSASSGCLVAGNESAEGLHLIMMYEVLVLFSALFSAGGALHQPLKHNALRRIL